MKTLYFITGTSSGIGYALTNHILSTENDVLVEGIKFINNDLGMLLIESMVRQLRSKSENTDNGIDLLMSFTEKITSKV